MLIFNVNQTYKGVYQNVFNSTCCSRCHVLGGGPTTDIRVHIGIRELTGATTVSRSSTMSGNRCMRRERFVVTRSSHQVEVTSEDDLASLNCSVTVASGQLPVASRATILYVKCRPIQNYLTDIYLFWGLSLSSNCSGFIVFFSVPDIVMRHRSICRRRTKSIVVFVFVFTLT